MSRDQILALIDAAASTIAANADELTRLDQAIGDGDHGSNMARGFQAVGAQRETLAAMEPGDALQKAGMVLVTTVGGWARRPPMGGRSAALPARSMARC